MPRTMLTDIRLPKQFWGEAVMYATYLINRLPTKANESKITPYELWHKRKPDLSNIKIFVCKAFAYIDKPKRGKLDEKAIEKIMLGSDFRSKGYRIYTGENKIIISRTVKFFEEGIKDEEIKPDKENQNNEPTPTKNIEIELEERDDDQINTGSIHFKWSSTGCSIIF